MSRFLVGLIGGPVLALTAIYLQLLLCDTVPPFRHTEYAPLNIKIRDAEGALARFARALSYRTVSNSNNTDHIESREAFRGLHVHITEAFPRVHHELQLKKVPSVSATPQGTPAACECLCSSDDAVNPGGRLELAVQMAWSKLIPEACAVHQPHGCGASHFRVLLDPATFLWRQKGRASLSLMLEAVI